MPVTVLAGAGNMGSAMLESWLKSNLLVASEIYVVESNAAFRDRAARQGAMVVSTVEELPAALDPTLIVIALKPQVISAAMQGYRRFGTGNTTFLSVAAGTRIAALEEMLGEIPIVRCMPNTPAAIGKGMMVTFENGRVSDAARALVNNLLRASGSVTTVETEDQMDAVTAVSGSGPAYVFHFIECLTAAAQAAGLPLKTAKQLAVQTVFGAASLAQSSQIPPSQLREEVTSPNGTTAAGLAVLMGDDRLKYLVGETVEAARARSIELG